MQKSMKNLIHRISKSHSDRTLRGAMRHWLSMRDKGMEELADALKMPTEYVAAWVNDQARSSMLQPFDVNTLATLDKYNKSQKKKKTEQTPDRKALVAHIKEVGAHEYVNTLLKDPRTLAELARALA